MKSVPLAAARARGPAGTAATGAAAGSAAGPAAASGSAPFPDADSRAWLDALRSTGHDRDEATIRLHELLLRAARHEVARRRTSVARLSRSEANDLAAQAADDALVAVLAKLDDFRGASRFTTWAYKFALLEAAVRVRRLEWQNREIPLEPEDWRAVADHRPGPDADAEMAELLGAVRAAVGRVLTPHQREVLVALAVNGVPIDVLAERLGTTRGALYKTLHDGRRKLRAELGARGFALGAGAGEGT